MRLCAVLRGVERLWEALGGFIDFGWLCHALGGFGFGRLWEAFEKPWGALGGCMSFTEALGGFGKFWEPLGSFGRIWEALGGFGKLWYVGKAWEVLQGFGRHGKAVGGFWMFWDALEGWQSGFGPMDALEGFGGVRSL